MPASGGAAAANNGSGANNGTAQGAPQGAPQGGPGGHEGGQPGPGMGGHEHTAVTGDEADKVIAAVKAKDSSVEVTEVQKDPDGSYDVMGTKDGQPVRFDVSADLKTVTEGQGGPGGHGGGMGGPGMGQGQGGMGQGGPGAANGGTSGQTLPGNTSTTGTATAN